MESREMLLKAEPIEGKRNTPKGQQVTSREEGGLGALASVGVRVRVHQGRPGRSSGVKGSGHDSQPHFFTELPLGEESGEDMAPPHTQQSP